MGKDLGVHPSSIGNVIHGRRIPGREILSAIGAHPLINTEWLLYGIGKPIRTDEQETAEIGLPIASRPFVGLPSENPNCLEDYLYPVTRRLYRASRYWMKISEHHPFVQDDGLKIASGDMVLFEPNPQDWPDELTDKPCLITVPTHENLALKFARCISPVVRFTSDVLLYDTNHIHKTNKKTKYHKQPGVIQLNNTSVNHSTAVELIAVGIFRCGPC